MSATIGSLSLRLSSVITTYAIPNVWRTWWLGDAIGALVVVPLVLSWRELPRRDEWRGRLPEAAAALVTVVALTELALLGARPLTYIAFPA